MANCFYSHDSGWEHALSLDCSEINTHTEATGRETKRCEAPLQEKHKKSDTLSIHDAWLVCVSTLLLAWKHLTNVLFNDFRYVPGCVRFACIQIILCKIVPFIRKWAQSNTQFTMKWFRSSDSLWWLKLLSLSGTDPRGIDCSREKEPSRSAQPEISDMQRQNTMGAKTKWIRLGIFFLWKDKISVLNSPTISSVCRSDTKRRTTLSTCDLRFASWAQHLSRTENWDGQKGVSVMTFFCFQSILCGWTPEALWVLDRC